MIVPKILQKRSDRDELLEGRYAWNNSMYKLIPLPMKLTIATDKNFDLFPYFLKYI